MTVTEFQAQCLELLKAAREWDDITWEQLEESWTMDIINSMMDLEHYLEEG